MGGEKVRRRPRWAPATPRAAVCARCSVDVQHHSERSMLMTPACLCLAKIVTMSTYELVE